MHAQVEDVRACYSWHPAAAAPDAGAADIVHAAQRLYRPQAAAASLVSMAATTRQGVAGSGRGLSAHASLDARQARQSLDLLTNPRLAPTNARVGMPRSASAADMASLQHAAASTTGAPATTSATSGRAVHALRPSFDATAAKRQQQHQQGHPRHAPHHVALHAWQRAAPSMPPAGAPSGMGLARQACGSASCESPQAQCSMQSGTEAGAEAAGSGAAIGATGASASSHAASGAAAARRGFLLQGGAKAYTMVTGLKHRVLRVVGKPSLSL